MTYVLRFLPEVEQDAIAGYAWYQEKASGLGDDFLRTFYACANEIQRNPLASPEVLPKCRRRLLRRFPYAIYFRIEGHEIIVLGLFHCGRDPQGIRTKILDRKRSEP